MSRINEYIKKLEKLTFSKMYQNDFFLTWDKTDDELAAVFAVADAMRILREENISTKIFDSGLAVFNKNALFLFKRVQYAGLDRSGFGRG